MNDNEMRELDRQEILELTDLLNTEWIDLRDLLIENNVNLKGAWLAAYVEDEADGAEHGVIVTADKKIIRFTANDGDITLQPIQDQAAIEREFPQVAVAMEL